jgi:hypothetical protein
MNKNICKRLLVSIFLPKRNWHLLIKELKSFIKQLAQTEKLLAYKLAFDYQIDEHIRVTLVVPSKKAAAIAELTNERLKKFFITKNLLPALSDNPNRSIFMPPLNNTLQYGFFSIDEDQNLEILEQAFSTLIIEAFADEKIDDEMIITFAIYILFDCYKLVKRVGTVAASKWQIYYKSIVNGLTTEEANVQLIEDQYSLQETDLYEIYTNIIDGSALDDIRWIETWEEAFNKACANIALDKHAPLLCAQVNNIINQQLSLSPNLQIIISSFVLKTIAKSEKINS